MLILYVFILGRIVFSLKLKFELSVKCEILVTNFFVLLIFRSIDTNINYFFQFMFTKINFQNHKTKHYNSFYNTFVNTKNNKA